MVKNIKLTNVESICKRHKEHNRKGIIEEHQQQVHSNKYQHGSLSFLPLLIIKLHIIKCQHLCFP